MQNRDDEDGLLRSVALQNAQSILLARQRAEEELIQTKEELQKQSETLRRSERELAEFFENATVGLHWVGADGTILRVNRAELEMLGYARDEYLGHHIAEFHADRKVIADILRRLQGGELLREYPAQLRCKDGSIRDVFIDSSVLWVDGEFVHARCFTRDVTDRKRAERTLRESEDRFRLMADSIPQLAWMARPDGAIYWYNQRWYEYTGTTFEQMEGWGWQSVHDPAELPKVIERWMKSIATGEPFDMVFPVRGADGVFRPFLTLVRPLRADDGSVLQWFGTNTDISEQRRAAESLAVSEERLRLALDAGRMGVWDWNIRTNEMKWSDKLELLYGLAPGAFGGTIDALEDLVHPDDRATVSGAIRQAVATRSGYEIEFRAVWPDGGVHWLADKGKVFADDDGKSMRMIGIGLDITRRKRADRAARFLADASIALASLVDYDSTLQKVASLAVPGFADWAAIDLVARDGALRRVALAHIDPSKVEMAHELHRRCPPALDAPHGVWNVLRTGKSELVAEITDALLASVIKDEEQLRAARELGLKSYLAVPLLIQGKPLGVITFISAESGHWYDASDLAVAEDLAHRAAIAIENSNLYRALREADRRKDEFLATLAHELRNPLAPIRNSLEILKMPRVDASTLEKTRDMMERQVQQLVRLVDDLLDVSRVMGGKIELRKERVELASVVARAVETAQPLIEANRHELAIKLPPDSLLLDADPVRLAQVLGNLLTNAAKYTEPNGRIRLTAQRDEDRAVVNVRDNGIGIAPDMLPHVFELFVQADHTATRSQGGLGIGLTLVKNLVEMHEGTVAAASKGLGHGSEFVVRLPLAAPDRVDGRVADDRGDAVPSRSSGRRLMVVDDNQDASKSLAMLLRLQGHEVKVAHDGPAALEMAKDYRPEMIFLDIGMPGMDGYEVARRMRADSGLAKVRLAALTGWGQPEDRRRSAEAGFDRHLVKPVEPKILAAMLAELIP